MVRFFTLALMFLCLAPFQASAGMVVDLQLPLLKAIPAQAVTTAPLAPVMTRQGNIEIGSPWSRANPPGQKIGAIYMVIRNLGDEPLRLVGAATERAVGTELHDTRVVNGFMQMVKLPEGIEIAPKSEVELRPGGLHIMLVGLTKSLRTGSSFPVTLSFSDGTRVDVNVVVWDVGLVRTTKK